MSNLMMLLENRVSAHQFAPSELSDADIHKLLAAASLAPTAYHLQNCYFTVVRSTTAKQQLQAAAYGQEYGHNSIHIMNACLKKLFRQAF